MAKYASLHAGLLARKGEASPALPSSFAGASYVDAPQPAVTARPAAAETFSETRFDGRATDRRDIEPPETPQRLLVRKPAPLRDDAPVSAPPSEPASPIGTCCGAQLDLGADPHAGIDRAARAQVRLTAEQKRRLRTVSVQMNWPQQRILSDALDAWLEALCEGDMSGCSCLRARPEN